MIETIVIYLVGLLGGVAVGVQTPIANAIGRRVGGTASSLIVHVSGALFSGVLLVVRGGEMVSELRSVPWWMFGAGLFGLILYLSINVTIPRIGATAAVMLIIVGQLLASLVIDHFGLLDVTQRPINTSRLIAVGLLLAGGYLIAR